MKLKSWQSTNTLQCRASSRGPTSSLSGPSNIREVQKSSKRKSTSDGSTEMQRKRRKGSFSTCESHTQTLSALRLSLAQDAEISIPISTETEGTKGQKRKSETYKPRKKSRKTPLPIEEPSHKTTTTTWSLLISQQWPLGQQR
ncbi:hypothetical protein Q8A73_024030 [Channa argus]|nr:hypothetical protein Q8A73_024030 [Channa argus]